MQRSMYCVSTMMEIVNVSAGALICQGMVGVMSVTGVCVSGQFAYLEGEGIFTS